MLEAQVDKAYSFDSYVDDESTYDVVARFDEISTERKTVVNTEYEDMAKFADLSVSHLHHVLKGHGVEQASCFGLAFRLRKNEKISTYATNNALGGGFKLLQKWSGYVIAIENGEFTAIIKDKTNANNPDEEVVMSIDELGPSDQRSLAIGSEIFWTIGYETNRSGSRSRKSEIRLRRLAPFCQEELDYAKEKTEEMKNLFGVGGVE